VFGPNTLSPDFWAVNTMLPPYAPTPNSCGKARLCQCRKRAHAGAAQQHKTIGDMLSAKGVDWAWYAGGWNAALEGHERRLVPLAPELPAAPPAVQLLRPLRPRHCRPREVPARRRRGQHARTNKFLADAEAGKLPAVSYYKPQGNLNMHAGYSDIDAGDRHIAAVIDALRASPQWEKMLIVITFDENGGWWDHVAPPKGDRWGPGTRIPAVIVSPHAKKGTVDHTIYDTGSIARFLTRRFGLEKLEGLKMREDAMLAAGGVAPET
jgi:acid phosphatase